MSLTTLIFVIGLFLVILDYNLNKLPILYNKFPKAMIVVNLFYYLFYDKFIVSM